MKKLLLFTVGFLMFATAAFFMFNRPYTKTIIVRGEPYDMMLYRDFYVGLPYWLLGVALMFLSFTGERIFKAIMPRST
jgi:hypothetical protein